MRILILRQEIRDATLNGTGLSKSKRLDHLNANQRIDGHGVYMVEVFRATKPSWLGQGKIRLHKHLEYYLIARRGNKNTSIMGVQVTKLLSVYFSKSHLSRFIMVWED